MSEFFDKIKAKNKTYKEEYEKLKNHIDSIDPNWEKGKDAKHIRMRFDQTARIIALNKSMQKKKTIKKSDYKADWPFTSDEITIIKTGKLWITCIIDGKEYALNGFAQESQPWLKFPHDAKKAIKGKDVGPFIKIGLGL